MRRLAAHELCPAYRVQVQVDLGAGWQTFAVILNNPPLTTEDVEAAIVA